MSDWWKDPEVLKKTRKRLGLTQTELAKKAGVKLSLIADIEIGRRRMTAEIMTPIWEALARADRKAREKMPLSSLMTAMDPEKHIEEARRFEQPQASQERIHALEELVQSQKQRIEGYRKLLEIDEVLIKDLLELKGLLEAEVGRHDIDEQIEENIKLRAENARLREWLDAEYVAALADAKAKELREEVHAAVAAVQKSED